MRYSFNIAEQPPQPSLKHSSSLGNVLTVISDYKIPETDASGNVTGYVAEIISVNDYYPFGMFCASFVFDRKRLDKQTLSIAVGTISDRSANSGDYRYSFNGQEADHEIKGEGNSVNYKYRMNDARIGRFFAVDPLATKYPHNSPYAFSENVVIDHVELEGLEKVKFKGGGSTEELDVSQMDKNQIQNEFDSRGHNFDSDWLNGRSSEHVWLVEEAYSTHEKWYMGTSIRQYLNELHYEYNYYDPFMSDYDGGRRFVSAGAASLDLSLEHPFRKFSTTINFTVPVVGTGGFFAIEHTYGVESTNSTSIGNWSHSAILKFRLAKISTSAGLYADFKYSEDVKITTVTEAGLRYKMFI